MSFRFPHPNNEDDFELFCLRFLRHVWKCPHLNLFGKRGERQFGIDIIDESGGTPFRAGQCKFHEDHKTIPPAEIHDEVREALKYETPLDEYHILTTGRKSALAQSLLIRLNREHLASGKFRLKLWTWADIENELSLMDEATQDFILRGDSGRSMPALMQGIKGVLAEHLSQDRYSSVSVIDAELLGVKAALDGHLLEVAEDRIKQIETRGVASLENRHRYEIRAYRSNIFMRRGEWAKAGRELLVAKPLLPTTERAQVNEALGLELTGDRTGAHRLAEELRHNFPHAMRLAGIWVRTAPDELSLEVVEAVALPFAGDDDEINLALAHRALQQDQLVEAEKYAREATEIDPQAPHGWFVLGQVFHTRGHEATKAMRESLLREAMANYDRAATLAHDQKWADLESIVRMNRGCVLWLLGSPKAESDLLKALDLSPDRRRQVDYAGYLVQVQRFDDALGVLTSLSGDRTDQQIILEAESRYRRNQGDDRTKAQTLLTKLAASVQSEGVGDAHVLLAQWAVETKDFSAIETALSTSPLISVHPILCHTLRAWMRIAQDKPEEATANLNAAAACVTESTDPDHLFTLAQILSLAGADDRALPLLERCYSKGIFNAQCRKLLDCARHLGRHAVVVRVCRELREAGESDKRLVETELGLLQRYDLPAALQLAEQYLASHPDDKDAALWQSWFALRIDRDDLVIRELARLPRPDETTPQGTGIVLAVLAATNQPAAGLQYAYEALREHFGEELAHGQYVMYFLQWSEQNPQMKIITKSGPGTAVCYVEEHDDTLRWVVIEDTAESEPALGEVGPDHHLAKAFRNHSVGDTVTISERGIQPRRAVVREVVHKFVRRFQDCIGQFQVRFPDSSAIQMIHVGSGDEFDPSPLIKGLEEQYRHIDKLNEHYRTHPIPLTLFAQLAGSDEFAAWSHLTNNPTLGIRCSSGQRHDTAAALSQMRSAKTIVLDITALITLASVELLPALRDKSRTYIVSQTTYDRLQDLIEREERNNAGGGRVMLTAGRSLALAETPPEDRGRYLTFLRSIRDAVKTDCQVRPCPAVAALDPKRREDTVKVIGLHNLESMVLASTPDSVLWTDDLSIGTIGRIDFGSRHVWTQVALHVLWQERVFEENLYHRATARMVGRHYHSLECNAWTILAAAEVAEWDMTRWPVPDVMKTLGNAATNPVFRLEAAAAAIRSAWWRTLSPFTRQAFLFAILNGIGNFRMIRRLREAVPSYFSLDVIAAGEVVEQIRIWLQTQKARLLV